MPLGILGAQGVRVFLVGLFNMEPGQITFLPQLVLTQVAVALLSPLLVAIVPVLIGARILVDVRGLPVPAKTYVPQMRTGRWLQPSDTYAVVLNQEVAEKLGVGDWVTLDIPLKRESQWQVVGLLLANYGRMARVVRTSESLSHGVNRPNPINRLERTGVLKANCK